MRRALRTFLSAILAAAGLLGATTPASAIVPEPSPSVGAQCDTAVDQFTGTCTGEVTVSGAGGNPGGRSSGDEGGATGKPASDEAEAGRSSANDDGRPACVRTDGGKPRPVPCTTARGIWQADAECYASATPSDPQPPPSSAVWEHFDEDFGVGQDQGAVYNCYYPETGETYLIYLFDPPTAAEAPPTPGEVARQAVAKLDLRAIEIGMAPQPPATAVVGLPVWLWVAAPSDETFGPATATATERGVTVTVTARVTDIVWDLGDGTTVSCDAGTAYQAKFGAAESPDCGHTFLRESGGQPGGAYTVTARSAWTVEWAGAGQTGTITLDPLVAQTQVTVAEGQVLVS
jgi:hypothetical protein